MDVIKAMESDRLTFSQIFSEYRHRFVLFANSYLKDLAVSEDVVMDSFMYYWENKDNLAANSNIPAYILTIIKHKCLNILRSNAIHARGERVIMDHNARMLKMKIETLEAFNPEELFTKEILELVNKAISTLPSKTREIFVRSRYQNQSYKEIAEELGITVKSVEFEISKAMKILRVTLKDYYPVLLLIFMSDFHC